MYIKSIKLCSFRNLLDAQLCFSDGVNLITGRNGQGKTNLIEAIYLLSTAKSFRTNHTEDVISWKQSAASVFGNVQRELSEVEVGLAFEGKLKRCFINGQQVGSVADLAGQMVCICFSPNDLALVKGAPGERRNFLDRFIISRQPGLVDYFVNYRRALRSKNKLLKEGLNNQSELDPWNYLLADSAHVILKERLKAVTDLMSVVNAIYGKFSGGDGRIDLSLKTNLYAADGFDRDSLRQTYTDNAGREIKQQSCLIGCHRDDLLIDLGGQNSRAFASQGQARSIILALKLGVISLVEQEMEDAPIVLLDDFDSELDAYRSSSFLEMILGQKRQVFVTGTDIGLFTNESHSPSACWEIDRGYIERTL